MTARLLLFLTACSSAQAFANEGEDKGENEGGSGKRGLATIKVAILDLKAAGVDEVLAANLTDVVVTELSQIRLLDVISRSEIQEMLSLEAEKQQLGCNDVSCLAEIGGALGADNIVTGSIGIVADSYIISLKFIDIKNSRVQHRVERQTRVDSELLAAAASAARQLVMPLLQLSSGVLLVRVPEEGADVFVDDRLRGVSPIAAMEMAAGPHELRVSKSGYVEWATEVEITPKKTRIVDAALIPSQELITAYEQRNASLRTWAWVSTTTAAMLGAAAVGLYVFADQAYYPNKVEPLRDQCNSGDVTCDRAVYDEAESRVSRYNAMMMAVYGLSAGFVVATGAAIYCWTAGEDPHRFREFHIESGSVMVLPSADGALLSAQVRF